MRRHRTFGPGPITRLRRDARGATIVEFALIAPVLLLTLLGLFDLGYNTYTSSVLQGAIVKAARGSTIEGATPATLDAKVEAAIRDVAPNATVTFERKSYTNFSDVGVPEDFTDLNGDGTCNNGEPFEDANNNGTWDLDRGKSGGGGARDAVLYTVSVSYPRAFPLGTFVGIPGTHQMQSQTVLRNQPWDEQDTRVRVGNC